MLSLPKTGAAKKNRWLFITEGFKAVVVLLFYVAWVWCQSFVDVSLYVCSFYFISVSVAEWPPLGK